MGAIDKQLRIFAMQGDERPVMEQVKSGLLIAVKMLASLAIAVTFLFGSTLIRDGVAIGWPLVAASLGVMVTTVKFWAAGFFGFIAFGAVRILVGIPFPGAVHETKLFLAAVFASFFAMAILCLRFASKTLHITSLDCATLAIAASSVLIGLFFFGDNYKAVVVFNVGNICLLVSWWAARISTHNRRKRHTASAESA